MDTEWINQADNISKPLSTFEMKVWLELIIIVIR